MQVNCLWSVVYAVWMVLKVKLMSEELAVVTEGGNPAVKRKRVAQPEEYQLHGVRQPAKGSTMRRRIYHTDRGATFAWRPGVYDNHTDDKPKIPRNITNTRWASTIGLSAVGKEMEQRGIPWSPCTSVS